MYLLQDIYIFFLNIIFKVTGKIKSETRTRMIQIICFIFPVYFILYFTDNLWRWLHNYGFETMIHYFGTFVLLIITALSIEGPLKRVKWNRPLFWSIEICGFAMFVISFIHPVGSGYRAFALMLMFIYPCLYFVWNNRRDYYVLFDAISVAMVAVMILYLLYCIFNASQGNLYMTEDNRVYADASNPNLFALFGLGGFTSALYLLVEKRESKGWLIFSGLGIASGFSIMMMGQSRITLLISIINVLVVIFFFYKYCIKKNNIFKQSIAIILMIVMIAAGSVISKAVPRLQNTAYQKQIAAEYEKQGLEAPAADPEQNEDSVINRLIPEEGATLNDYSSSRFTYWKGYARELNMLGNDFSKADWDKMTQKNIYHAHNNFLEMGFRFGIPVGILFLFIELVAGCVTLGYLFMNRKKETYLIYPVIFMVAFTVGSMLEISTLPFEREIPFFFFIALAPIFDRTLNRKDKCEEPEELKEANN